MKIESGVHLGPYEIVSAIGAGGMGEVYKARDTRLDRSVAIKVLPSHLSSSPQLRERFDREARAISSLNHPNICTLHDVGHQEGIDYLVMELLEGETLADRLTRGPLPLSDVLKYGAQIADGLARAHRQGITHRDLKPGNIMLTKSGAKLLDFGLARVVPATILADAPTEQQKPLTAEGTILGTFQYMAPEQIEGLEADARTDIFAFGAVLYEMTTGRRAFEGKTKTSLIAAIVDRDPPSIATILPFTPPALEQVIRTCLAKDPDERWQSVHDIQLQLRAVAEQSLRPDPANPPARRRTSERVAWIVAALALAAVVTLFLATRGSRGQTAPRPFYASVAPPPNAPFLLGGPYAGSISISPDSRYMTFIAPGNDAVALIWIRDFVSREVRALTGTEGAVYPFWSPDSRQIGFFMNQKLKTISVNGGASVDVCDVREPRGGSWGRNDVILFTPHWRDPIYRVSVTGGKPVPLTKLDSSRNETTHRWPFILPDGKHFLYFAGSHTSESTSGDNAVYIGKLDGGPARLLLRARSNVTYAAGHLLFLREQQLVAQKFDLESLQLVGEPMQLATGVRYEKGFFQAVFAASDDLLIYQGGGSETKSRLTWFDRNGVKGQTLSDPGTYYEVSLSPDGKNVATSIGDPSDLWLFDLERGGRRRFTFDSWSENAPTWSADSKSLYYDSDRNLHLSIFRRALGSAAAEPVATNPEFHERPLDQSSDGRFTATSRARTDGKGRSDIWIRPTAPGSQPFPYLATPFDEWDAKFSPDGTLVAYVSNQSGRDEVYVASFPQPVDTWAISTEGGSAPRWRGDGREIFYVARNQAIMALPVAATRPFNSGPAKVLFQVPLVVNPMPSYDVTADGQRFLLNQPESTVEEPVTVVMNWTSIVKPK